MIRPLLVFTALLLCAQASACVEIDGKWKHSAKKAWIIFSSNGSAGEARISRHEANPIVEGEIIIQAITPGIDCSWNGEMFNGEGFTPITILNLKDEGLSVRTAESEVLRLYRDKDDDA